ncbi:hypothetical protein NU688_07000 [Variovorax sp. ZS18.2.2]|uniref:hypothetical protein n=1 Tax=Variovorax sp. ZS18.2.2 TaxID=2971255 RepID=UPI0021511A78|nr:hypothetical protein [Variovorax sp. ZS18.2.2]MCR6475897.1 hypothetical protein [Variovorax sp. ZS18.2.2]
MATAIFQQGSFIVSVKNFTHTQGAPKKRTRRTAAQISLVLMLHTALLASTTSAMAVTTCIPETYNASVNATPYAPGFSFWGSPTPTVFLATLTNSGATVSNAQPLPVGTQLQFQIAVGYHSGHVGGAPSPLLTSATFVINSIDPALSCTGFYENQTLTKVVTPMNTNNIANFTASPDYPASVAFNINCSLQTPLAVGQQALIKLSANGLSDAAGNPRPNNSCGMGFISEAKTLLPPNYVNSAPSAPDRIVTPWSPCP